MLLPRRLTVTSLMKKFWQRQVTTMILPKSVEDEAVSWEEEGEVMEVDVAGELVAQEGEEGTSLQVEIEFQVSNKPM